MIIEGEKVSGKFISRLNRFLALAKIDGEVTPCFLPDPGRLKELLFSGARVIMRKPDHAMSSKRDPQSRVNRGKIGETGRSRGKDRKTEFDMLAVVFDEGGENKKLVSLDCRLPNKLVSEALLRREIKEFQEYNRITPEYPYGSSRLDFMLEQHGNRNRKSCLLEVKSCNLVVDRVALFPDAPTKRGKRHLEEHMKAKASGNYYRACVMFVVQRDGAQSFEPNSSTDPEFAESLRQALTIGVEAYAYTVDFTQDHMTLLKSIPINAHGC
jgi:sugar fermentation stimulation protein A